MIGETLIIYLTPDKKVFRKITPSEEFEGSGRSAGGVKFRTPGDWRRLVDDLTNSFPSQGVINYHTYEVLQ